MGLREQSRPVEGDQDSERVTVPVNLLDGVTVMPIVAFVPAVEVTVSELAEMVKSTTLTVITAVERDRDPLVPVTITV